MNRPQMRRAARAPTRDRPDSKTFRQATFSTKPTAPLATPYVTTGCRGPSLVAAFVARLTELGGALS
jgi:hypothetical protein